MASNINLLVITCALFASVTYGAVLKNQTTADHHHVSSKGICHLEVPTIDLIHEDERTGKIPAGNGSRAGYSKIQICCSGYQLLNHSAFFCVPVCDNGCENGNCTAPNVCECKKGYIKDPSGQCVPTCPIGCLNGVCSVSKVCSCNTGYTLDPTGEMCLPICKGGCGIGGECVAPETCKCKPGFEKSVRGICEYHCDGGCEGGDCVGPNKCVCRPGFERKDGACRAMCVGGCRNGDCVGPNKCECKFGWKLDKSGTECQAHCDQPCLNGICSAPNQCTCKTGYAKDPQKSNRCLAHCKDGCPNGVCSAPNFCLCNPGYTKQSKGSNVCIKRERRYAIRYDLIPEQIE
ncbi:PREDICTED: von Willebrand factor D and EGF domain-containing protein-like [Nicrophorus vespilloides]|uniref:von Willebrand factor D and EGF domain-containing protein-like n=1 Tax=Nicrophorus vespilloides TaxID=110193 RepID=A0ABM1M4B5_NICVS|nr:PREDICTED: von Willebrand factor D and EGF domain-containing protein-like [Nicrophorus vespilloides]